MAFNACTEEYDYIPETNIDLQGAYILTDETTLILGEDDAQQLQFTVARHDSTEAATYKLYTTNSSINIPTEVSFAANEGTKHFTVDFDFPIGTIEEDVTIGVEERTPICMVPIRRPTQSVAARKSPARPSWQATSSATAKAVLADGFWIYTSMAR